MVHWKLKNLISMMVIAKLDFLLFILFETINRHSAIRYELINHFGIFPYIEQRIPAFEFQPIDQQLPKYITFLPLQLYHLPV